MFHKYCMKYRDFMLLLTCHYFFPPSLCIGVQIKNRSYYPLRFVAKVPYPKKFREPNDGGRCLVVLQDRSGHLACFQHEKINQILPRHSWYGAKTRVKGLDRVFNTRHGACATPCEKEDNQKEQWYARWV